MQIKPYFLIKKYQNTCVIEKKFVSLHAFYVKQRKQEM